MYNPIKSSFLGKVPAARVHQEKSTESNIKNFHTLEKRKDVVVETFIKSQTSSVKHNITVVNLECKEFHNIDLQGNSEFLDKGLLNSKIRNAFAILKPSKVLPLDSQTDPRTTVSEKMMNLPLSRYKRHDKRVCNQNSSTPIEEQELEKYKRDKRKIAQRPHSQTSRSKIEKYIEAFETNGYFSQTKSGEDVQIFSSGPNPGKYKRQQERFAERPYSQTSWEEIEKYIKSFELKNKNSYFHESRELDQNFSPSGGEKSLGNSGKQQIQLLEKPHSNRPQNEIEKSPVELDKHSHFQQSSSDLGVQDQNSGQPVGEKKHGKYKRSEHRLAERPYSQPSKKETEKYLKSSEKWKNSLFLESKSGNLELGNEDENLIPFNKERNPEKYRKKSQFKERPSSQILGSRIQKYVEAFESKNKCFHESDFDQLEFDTQEQDQNNSEPETNSVKYERYQPSFTDKSCLQILRTDLKNSMGSCELDGQSFSHQIEKSANQSLSEPSNAKIKQIEQTYSRSHQQNNRSISAPTVFIQTNVPNYFEYSSVIDSGYGFTRKKQNHIKETEETEETHSVKPKHPDISRRKTTTTSLLTDQRLKSPDLTALQQEQSHVNNGHLERRNLRNKEGKDAIPDFLSLQSIFNRRPNKKAGEDIQDYGNIKENIDLESESYSPISQRHQKERPLSNYPSKSLHTNTNFDLENTQIELDISRETEGIIPGNKQENTSKANKSHQDNSKTNQLLLDSVQTNAPLYYLKLSNGKKRPATKKKELKEPSKILNSCKSNMSNNSSTDSLSPLQTPENEIPAKSKYNSGQNEDERHFGHLTKDIVPEANNKKTPLLKKNKSFFTYHHSSENNINSLEQNYPSHSLDKKSFQNVPETKENHSVGKAPENLGSSMDEKLSPVRVRNGPNQSSENEMGPANLDWSISEISIVENEIEAEELTRSQVDGSTLLSPVENDIYHYASHDLEVSKKMSSNSLTEFSKELKRSFSSSQFSKNSVKINKKLKFLSTEDRIESVKCQFMLRKYFSLWKKEWHKHLAAKILWKQHSLQKGLNALRQAAQNSQLVSQVLQERIKKVWLNSCFQKWKQETSIKLHDQLAAAFQKWKENAKEQKRFRILKQIHHRNVILLCFQKWRSHYKSKIMLLRALMHNRMSLLYSMWHHWIMFVKQNQQKKFWQVMARKYQRKKLQSRTLKGLVSAYRNVVKATSHYRLQKMKMVLQFWRRGTAVSSHQSELIVAAVQQCSNQLALRRTLDIWVHQLWLICESRRADRWILSRYLSIWYRKWCCTIAWRQTVVAKIEHQQTRAVIYKWHQNVQLQKQQHKLATKHIQRVLLIQLLRKWRRITKRQVESRLHLQTQVTNGQYRMKIQVLLKWKNKLLEKQKARQVYYLWSEQCVRKAVSRWKDSHHQATLNKRALLFEPLRNVLIQKEIFGKWKQAWQKVNEEKEDAHRSHAILQQKLLGAIFNKWHSRTQGTLAAKPLIQRRCSQLLLRIFRAWHHFLWEKHQRTKKSLQLQNYHLKQLFHKWRNLFILREKEKNVKIYHCRRLLSKCVLGWQVVIQRKTRAMHFHQGLLLRKFFFWKEKTTHSLRCKAMKEAEQHSCRTVQRHFFSRWRQNAVQQKIHRTESTRHIEKIHKRNVLTQALTSWKHLLKIHILARNHSCHRLVILMRQVLVQWHWFTEYTSCLAVRCLQRRLSINAWMKCPHISRHWQEEEVLQEELNNGNGSTTEESHQTTGTDEDALAAIGLRNQKVMTRMILQLKYWPMSFAFLQWRRYTQLCHQLKTVTQQLHLKHITVILSTTFCLWRQQQQAAKLARRHQEHKLMKRTFREIQKYAVCRRSKKALLTKARNHHCVSVFKTCFPIWQKKVKEKQYWDKAAKLLSHSSPEEQLLQPIEFQLTSLLGQRSLQACFHIWQETYQEASFYRQQYHQMLLIRYLHIWRSWAMYRQHLTQKCNEFRKKRIQSLALQVWTCRIHQNKWIKKTQGQKVNSLLLTILRQWHQWSSKSSKQKAAEAKVQQNHVTLMFSQVFNSITREFHKISKACQWYQNQLIRKVIVVWSYRSQFQIQERAKIKKFQLQKNKAMIQIILQIWKHAYLVRCEAKFNREQRIHLKVCYIAVHWKKRAKKTRGKILETVFTDRMVRFCFSVWRNRFEMMKQLEGQLHLFVSWKQQQTQRHLFTRWKSTLLVTRANQSFKNKLLSKVLKGWQKWTRASLLYQRRFQEYQNFLQKRQMESTFRIWKIGWKHKQTSTKLFKHNIQSRALKAWYYYVQGQVRLKILQAYLADQLRSQHLLSAYYKWKGMVTARMNERRKEKQQAVLAEQHYKTHLSMVFFHAWLQETLVSRCIVRHQMRLAYKYCNRWKYYTDLSYTAALWSEKLSYHRVWCKWRAVFIREKTAAIMEAEFCQQNMRQIFRIWYQYCRYKKIHEKESLFPGICLNLANI